MLQAGWGLPEMLAIAAGWLVIGAWRHVRRRKKR
jgi:hypothetical protein